ncbi:MAG: trypsin-like peptidase domain-containing protein [Phycisphaerales bacterium]
MIRRLPAAVLVVLALATGVRADDPVGRGQDPFDQLHTIDELRTLEKRVVETAARVRPAVVQLRLGGERRGGFASTTGTGVVITPDGLVASCGHVGGRAGRKVEAVLADGTVLRGRTLGQANRGMLDCGLIQLETEGRDLESAPLGTSTGLAEGDWLIALGFTQGPPEEPRPALLRVGRVLRNDADELLFDAPIDAGDSGGPSFNLRGEVVALNSRCGRQPWENAATPVDRLRERIQDLHDGLDESLFALVDADEEESVHTNFTSGASPHGRLAVQRGVPLAEVASRAMQSTLRVVEGGDTVGYATVVDPSGLAVTKLSLLREGATGARVSVETRDGTRREAEVVGRDPRLDLALLQVAGEPLPAVEWTGGTAPRPGEVLLSPRLGPNGPALGFAAIERRESDRAWDSMPYLGVRSEAATMEEIKTTGARSAIRVDEVVKGSAAEAAGLREGDLLVTLDGEPLGGRNGLRRAIAQREVGDTVSIEYVREGERATASATLARRADPDRPVRRGNTTTPISKVSTGFGVVLAHDANIWPEQCGGPVVDLDGKVVGINIARFDRTATHALPAERVRAAVESMRTAAVSAPTRPTAKESTPAEGAR